jgi:hypothetical protein
VTITEWSAAIAAVATTVTVLLGGLRWLVKHWLSELKPNGGASIKVQVTRLETRVDDIYRILLEKK